MDNNITRIITVLNSGLNLLGRKIDSLAIELRNRKTPIMNSQISISEDVSKGISNAVTSSLDKLKIPTPNIIFPDQNAPIVNIPAPIVNVDAPIVNVPAPQITLEPTPVNFPEEMKVERMDELIKSVNRETSKSSIFEEVSYKNPLPMIILDSKGRQVNDFGGDMTAPSVVGIKVGTTQVTEDHPLPVTVDGFAIPMFDTQIIDETLAPATTIIQYKRNGVLVATKTITIVGAITTVAIS